MKRHQQGPPTAKMAGVSETMFSLLLLGDAGATSAVGLDAISSDIGAGDCGG